MNPLDRLCSNWSNNDFITGGLSEIVYGVKLPLVIAFFLALGKKGMFYEPSGQTGQQMAFLVGTC